ncbi:hypothetical protein OG594_46935 [Streptomyces sp. NBC_01214]|uniref:hypothetical protein n=1 Tax=Streptomyces sp. NBC_01214 TaxID=2903777 RepID=UPI00224F8668|nr:hypothetical protein [Streptomyces sp. NBC_01214]MCX4808993.1 hypothetical protein [Streptomyces sp. NBC_01214]
MFGRKKSTTPTATTAPATPAGADERDDDRRSFMWEFGDLDDPAPGAWTTDPTVTDRAGR